MMSPEIYYKKNFFTKGLPNNLIILFSMNEVFKRKLIFSFLPIKSEIFVVE